MAKYIKDPRVVEAYKVGSDEPIPDGINSIVPLPDGYYDVETSTWFGKVREGDYIVIEYIPSYEELIIYTIEGDAFECIFVKEGSDERLLDA